MEPTRNQGRGLDVLALSGPEAHEAVVGSAAEKAGGVPIRTTSVSPAAQQPIRELQYENFNTRTPVRELHDKRLKPVQGEEGNIQLKRGRKVSDPCGAGRGRSEKLRKLR